MEKDASLRTKIQMAIDISNGMSYLEEHHFVHRVRPASLCSPVDFLLSSFFFFDNQ